MELLLEIKIKNKNLSLATQLWATNTKQ